MTAGGTLQIRIEGFSTLEEHGIKADGTPDVRRNCGYKLVLVLEGYRILFEETLPRNQVPVDPTQYLVQRIARILTPYLPQIDPQ